MKKKILSLILSASLALGALAIPASAATTFPFTDVPENAWYAPAVSYVYEDGLFGGTSPTTFSPHTFMTRAMFVQVLANNTSNFNSAEWADKGSFSDVSKDAWYASAVEWAYAYGLVNGKTAEKFDPNGLITRQDIAVLLYRYAEKTHNDISVDETQSNMFSDYLESSAYARRSILWASQHKILSGYGDGSFRPLRNASRAEVATVFMNADGILLNDKISHEGATPTPRPTNSPVPTITPTPAPTVTPVPTLTPIPTATPTVAPTSPPAEDIYEQIAAERQRHKDKIVALNKSITDYEKIIKIKIDAVSDGPIFSGSEASYQMQLQEIISDLTTIQAKVDKLYLAVSSGDRNAIPLYNKALEELANKQADMLELQEAYARKARIDSLENDLQDHIDKIEEQIVEENALHESNLEYLNSLL